MSQVASIVESTSDAAKTSTALVPIEKKLQIADDACTASDQVKGELSEKVQHLRGKCQRLDEIEYEIGLLLDERRRIAEELEKGTTDAPK